MKRSILLIYITLILCVGFCLSASAIDTPWLPIEPDKTDGAKTEASSPNEENDNATDAVKDGGHTTDALPSDSKEGSIEADSQKSDGADEATSKETGCGSTLGEYAVLACCLTASACVIKSRKENE